LRENDGDLFREGIRLLTLFLFVFIPLLLWSCFFFIFLYVSTEYPQLFELVLEACKYIFLGFDLVFLLVDVSL
jgi:hypothetical protein